MGAFEYTTKCLDCNHIWGGMWFSFNASTVAKGMYQKNVCPNCKSYNTKAWHGKDELNWDEDEPN